MFWRSAGLTYLNYSRIAAKVVRNCTKSSTTGKAQGQAPSGTLTMTPWESGKIAKKV